MTTTKMQVLLLLLVLIASVVCLGNSFSIGPIGSSSSNRVPSQIRTSPTRLDATTCVIGGGVSGLAAALTVASSSNKNDDDTSVIILEASESFGGRVQSDVTENGFTLDRGFAVFIEQYPWAKELLDYNALQLGSFLPGALVKLPESDTLARVSDPLRVPGDLFAALFANVGTLQDKIRVLPLVLHVRTKSIDELFQEPETDTLTALRDRWGFSDDMITKFFAPFLEGIYLAPLEEQSSRMFSFVFKMFSEGAATLPAGGMGAVSQQLVDKATAAGVTFKPRTQVKKIINRGDNKGFELQTSEGKVRAENVILATEGPVAQTLLSTVRGLESLASEEGQPQRQVGCLYYSFDTEVPIKDPILILNGSDERGSDKHPVNNCCFPSVVRSTYAPPGSHLCSATILKVTMDSFAGRDDELDAAVRRQLSAWFPKQAEDILNKWKLERIYKIHNAQPSQLGGPEPANVNHGRPCDSFRGMARLPAGLFVCGDHVSTATLNGALESGVNAGKAAAS